MSRSVVCVGATPIKQRINMERAHRTSTAAVTHYTTYEEHKGEEVLVVATPNAVGHPSAVVVEALHARVTELAVL